MALGRRPHTAARRAARAGRRFAERALQRLLSGGAAAGVQGARRRKIPRHGRARAGNDYGALPEHRTRAQRDAGALPSDPAAVLPLLGHGGGEAPHLAVRGHALAAGEAAQQRRVHRVGHRLQRLLRGREGRRVERAGGQRRPGGGHAVLDELAAVFADAGVFHHARRYVPHPLAAGVRLSGLHPALQPRQAHRRRMAARVRRRAGRGLRRAERRGLVALVGRMPGWTMGQIPIGLYCGLLRDRLLAFYGRPGESR